MPNWETIVEKTCEYEEEIDPKANCEKIVSIWLDYPNAINNRVTTAIKYNTTSDVGREVLGILEQEFKIAPEVHNNLEIRKFITADRKNDVEFSENAFEVSFFEEEFLVRFYPVVLDGGKHPHFDSPYTISCRVQNQKSLNLEIQKPLDSPLENYKFLITNAFPKLFKWLQHVDLSKETRKTHSLIDRESYSKTYKNIRNSAGRPICQEWTEKSNPEKAVFEDCGIASYLIELIHADILPKPRKFVDIGCGNGLLVHLLSKFDLSGYGVDVRERRIWKTVFKNDDLRESTVNPQFVVSNEPHFDSGVDLLIGNHSDELTPWIPVMAAKLKCNFFLIPCCPWNFFGKYNNNGSHLGNRRLVSQYESFFEWTASIAQRLGFDVKIDRLAIPSTKRLCIIGRVPEDGLVSNIDEVISLMTQGKTFVARPHEIKNNNCMNIPIPDRERIAKQIFEYILNSSDNVVDGWRIGGVVLLSELVEILNEDDKKMMKDQDGGLQTFLRNNHQIFNVYGGAARIRDQRIPTMKKKGKKGAEKKTKKNGKSACWMASHHPDGCPVEAEKCHYAH